MAPRTIIKIPKKVAVRILSTITQVLTPDFLEDFRYLCVPHKGFDGKNHEGELVVHKSVAEEVFDIFLELFEGQFPIEKIRLIEEYNADDNASMADNNSSAFCYRLAVGKPGILSKHALGLAVDINPLYNPYVKGKLILPPEGAPFMDRTKDHPGIITKEGVCYKAFTRRGWIWGGVWPDRQDYHHFEKP